ncbi:MAG: methyltransferase domain-containing protein [Desulfarculales bacterium]|nr:methyltransferase domain-containing protein [Desulfarculales bacterium]
MEKNFTAGEILDLAMAYWGSCALQAGVQIDLFSALAAGPRSEQELAARLGCDGRAFNMLVSALASMGFLHREGDKVIASGDSIKFLARSSPEYVGFIILHHAHIMPAWSRLAQAVRSGQASAERLVITTSDEEEREAFLLGMFNIAQQQAGSIAQALDLSGRSRLLDIGGGPGTYAVHFCRRNPELRAAVIDLPASEPIARKIVTASGLADRIDFVGGDYFSMPLPQGDVVWLSQVIHGENPEQAALLIKKAAACLPSGGLLGVQEFVLNDDRGGPQHPALFSLAMLVETASGQAYTQREIKTMMQAAGVKSPRRLEVDLPQGCQVLVGEMA